MDRKFICDECSNIYSSRQSRWRHKKNDHAKSVPYCSYTAQRPTVKGGDLETLKKILQSSNKEEEKHRTKEDIEKIVQKVLQSLDEKSDVEETSEDGEKEKTNQDIEKELFGKVTLKERKRFNFHSVVERSCFVCVGTEVSVKVKSIGQCS